MTDYRQVVKNIFHLTGATIFTQATLAVTGLFIARGLGSSSFGQYTASFSLTKVTSIFFNLGLDVWLLRQSLQKEKDIFTVLVNVFALKLCLGFVWWGILSLLGLRLDASRYPFVLLQISVLTTVSESLLTTLYYGFNLLLLNHKTLVVSALNAFLLMTLTFLFLSVKIQNPAIYALARMFVAFFSVMVALIWWFRRFFAKPQWTFMKQILRESPAYAISDLLLTIYAQIDITLIAIISGVEATGVYGSASSLLRAMLMFPSSIHMVMTPLLSRFIREEENSESFMRAVKATYAMLLVAGGFLFVFVYKFGPYLVEMLLGASYALAGNILRILSLIFFFKSISYAAVSVIVALGQQEKRLGVQYLTAALNVILNLWWLPTYGIYGAAWAYVISEGWLAIGYVWISCREYNRRHHSGLNTT